MVDSPFIDRGANNHTYLGEDRKHSISPQVAGERNVSMPQCFFVTTIPLIRIAVLSYFAV